MKQESLGRRDEELRRPHRVLEESGHKPRSPLKERGVQEVQEVQEVREVRDERLKAQKQVLGHHASKNFYFVIVALLAIIIAVSILHISTVRRLNTQNRELATENALLQSELDHYKEAYRIAVDDAAALGRIQQLTYIPENDSAPKVTVPVAKSAKRLPEKDVWGEYSAQGFIKDDCIPTTKVVETPNDLVDVVIVARGERGRSWPRLTLLIDGTVIERFSITSSEQGVYKSSVVLPKGTHHLDLLYDNADEAGPVTIDLLRIGDRTLKTGISVIDYGAAFGVFDCEDTAQGNTLKKSGAMRFRIEKV